MYRQMYVLQSGRKVVVENGWKKRVYHPGNFSLRRVVRLLLKRQGGKQSGRGNKSYRVSSTTGGWDTFNTARTDTRCTCEWHLRHYPDRVIRQMAEDNPSPITYLSE